MTTDREQDIHQPPGPPFVPPAARDLTDLTGLPLRLTPLGWLDFGGTLPPVAPQPRTLADLRPMLYNQTAAGPAELYLMYRGVGWPEDVARYSEQALRFDVTVLVPGLVGAEYVKTAGHYHPGGYPELYQVVAGRAHYLLQKPATGEQPDTLAGAPPGAIADVIIVEAEPGDAVFVPPGYGHVTINPGPEPLAMVNVVDSTFTSVYGPYRERRGAAYYEIEERGQPYFVANDHYPDLPEPRLVRPTKLEDLGLQAGEPLYAQLAGDPRAFAFLSEPRADQPEASRP